jgi:hypothetical protein
MLLLLNSIALLFLFILWKNDNILNIIVKLILLILSVVNLLQYLSIYKVINNIDFL